MVSEERELSVNFLNLPCSPLVGSIYIWDREGWNLAVTCQVPCFLSHSPKCGKLHKVSGSPETQEGRTWLHLFQSNSKTNNRERPGRDLGAAWSSRCWRALPPQRTHVKPTALLSHLVPTQETESGALAEAFKPPAFIVCRLIFPCADLQWIYRVFWF